MRKSIAALAFVVLTLASLAAAWQNSAAEKTAIVAVAQSYMDAYYTADVGRMRQALHPEFHKRTLQIVNGRLQTSDDSVQSVLAGVSSGTGITVPPTERVQKIEVLDVYKDVASVKVVTGRWVDYMHLSRLDGEWRVLDVVLQYTRQQ